MTAAVGGKFRLAWGGEKLAEQVHDAELAGLNTTGERMVTRARSSHPGWKSQTGEAEESIEADEAERTSTGARLRFGSTLRRFIFLEVGARGRAGDHTLRRAQDVEGGHLAERIKLELGQ